MSQTSKYDLNFHLYHLSNEHFSNLVPLCPVFSNVFYMIVMYDNWIRESSWYKSGSAGS